MKVKFLCDYLYSFDGINATSFKEGEVAEVPEEETKLFRKLGKVAIHNGDKDKKKKKKAKKEEE